MVELPILIYFKLIQEPFTIGKNNKNPQTYLRTTRLF